MPVENDQLNGLLEFQHQIIEQLKLQRFHTVQEKQTQSEVELYLTSAGYSFEREKRLSERDIPDFFLTSQYGSLVLEVKIRCPKRQIFRQLERYASHESVYGLILLSGTSMGLPIEINKKPSRFVSLGEGWL